MVQIFFSRIFFPIFPSYELCDRDKNEISAESAKIQIFFISKIVIFKVFT